MAAKIQSFLKIVQRCNTFRQPGSSKPQCRAFFIGGKHLGWIRPDAWNELKHYPSVFIEQPSEDASAAPKVHLSDDVLLGSFEGRSCRMAEIMTELRQKNTLVTLKGWRDECYDVWWQRSEPPLMKIERATTALLGVNTYGTHVNGYTLDKNKGMQIWLARRALNKPTYPGRLDNMVGGGIASGDSVLGTAIKECQEEASIPTHLSANLKSAGTVSYIFEDERGVFPECEFVFDLELPSDFTPGNADGEVSDFYLLSIDEVKEKILSDEFKPNSALVQLHFLIRHGFINPDKEPNYTKIEEEMHVQLF